MTSSWRYQHGFPAEIRQFLSKATPFYDCAAKKLMKLLRQWISLHTLPSAFDMENSEILDFQFEPTKALQPDSGSGKSSKTCSSADREPSTARPNEISINDWCICFNHSQKPAAKKWLCYLELNACEYFKMNWYIYLLTILQAFFTKIINEHTVTLL